VKKDPDSISASSASESIDTGEPIDELAEARLRTSEDFLPRLLDRIDNHHTKLHAAEFALFSVGRVLKEYLRLILAIFGAEPKERK
jgi:hypothetical protein